MGTQPLSSLAFSSKTIEYMVADTHVAETVVTHLNWPHGFTKVSDSCRRVKDKLSSIHSEGLPIHRVVSSITYVYCNLAKLCLKHWVPSVALHVISTLIEVSHPWNMVLSTMQLHIYVSTERNSTDIEVIHIQSVRSTLGLNESRKLKCRFGIIIAAHRVSLLSPSSCMAITSCCFHQLGRKR